MAPNTPEGCGAVEGVTDPHAQRVDVETGRLVDWQPPAPDADHEWNATTRRWQKKADVAAREALEQAARKRIDALELAQHRPLRELSIDPQNATARTRLAEIDAEIAVHRVWLE